jgi:ABC-type uncharacterized transport system ATPase subunit
VLGLVGTNGIGKSTALKILAGKLKVRCASLNITTISRDHPKPHQFFISFVAAEPWSMEFAARLAGDFDLLQGL